MYLNSDSKALISPIFRDYGNIKVFMKGVPNVQVYTKMASLPTDEVLTTFYEFA